MYCVVWPSWKSTYKTMQLCGIVLTNSLACRRRVTGVIDTPDRILIMTSNHPEKLDPALIRPGRINRKLYLGNVRLPEAASMMRHYFAGGAPRLPEPVEARLAAVFVDNVLSPAQVEAMCAEFDGPEEMIEALAGKLAAVTSASSGLPLATASCLPVMHLS